MPEAGAGILKAAADPIEYDWAEGGIPYDESLQLFAERVLKNDQITIFTTRVTRNSKHPLDISGLEPVGPDVEIFEGGCDREIYYVRKVLRHLGLKEAHITLV